jgi:hypothetical protein
MRESLQFYWCVVVVGALAIIANIAGNMKRIADKLEWHESAWSKGYTTGYRHAKRGYPASVVDEEDDE